MGTNIPHCYGPPVYPSLPAVDALLNSPHRPLVSWKQGLGRLSQGAGQGLCLNAACSVQFSMNRKVLDYSTGFRARCPVQQSVVHIHTASRFLLPTHQRQGGKGRTFIAHES